MSLTILDELPQSPGVLPLGDNVSVGGGGGHLLSKKISFFLITEYFYHLLNNGLAA